jgi:ABC-type transport system involved in multi-copper enzyme maturation permease subunit
MSRQLRAELLKLRTTRTATGMVATMVALVVGAIALHALGLPARRLAAGGDQLGIFTDVGANLGTLFAALLGVLAIAGEVRNGTIRPTLLATPQRARVIAAKAIIMALTGAVVGALATAAAAGVGSLLLQLRGVTIHVGAGDYALLVAGGAAAAGLWAVIGVGVGSAVGSQVPAVVGLMVWVLFIENILGDSIPKVAKFAPAALARATAGATTGTLHNPAAAVLLLALYSAAAAGLGLRLITQRDIA